MGSWTGKFDPLRRIHDKVTKRIGFDPSLASNVHTKIANEAHAAADSALNQEPVGSENRKRNKFRATFGRTAQERADRVQRVTSIMRSA